MQMIRFLVLGPIVAALAGVAGAQDDIGKTMYAVCTACHGPDGQGVVAGDKRMAPTLTGSAVVNGDPSIFALVVLNGIAREDEDYLQAMAPLPLPDLQLAAVLSYVRASFGNKAPAVAAQDVAKFREKWKDVKGPITRAKLEELQNKVAPKD